MLICYECGKKHGEVKYHATTYQNGKCAKCRAYKPVTSASHFGLRLEEKER